MDKEVIEAVNKAAGFVLEGRHTQAIEMLNAALIRAGDDVQSKAAIYCHRAETLIAHAQSILSKTNEESIIAPINGQSPLLLAETAGRDSVKALEMNPSLVAAHVNLGHALMMQGRYEPALSALQKGLDVDPTNATLQELTLKVREHLGGNPTAPSDKAKSAVLERLASSGSELFECPLCVMLLLEPVTTPCGHTFCRVCLARSVDHQATCPVCRQPFLMVPSEHPVNVLVSTLIQTHFPDELRERKKHEDGVMEDEANSNETSMALFVLMCAFPGEKHPLHIFEPRYRLMIRRCMEAGRKFGCVSASGPKGTTPSEVGTIMEITDCHTLPDGRFYIETVCRQRFKVKKHWDQDGYTMGRVEVFGDDASNCDEETVSSLLGQVESLKSAVSETQWEGILGHVGQQPSRDDLEALSFWLCRFVPPYDEKRYKLLSCESTKERFEDLATAFPVELPGSNQRCSIM